MSVHIGNQIRSIETQGRTTVYAITEKLIETATDPGFVAYVMLVLLVFKAMKLIDKLTS